MPTLAPGLSAPRLETLLLWCARIAVALVVGIAALDWVGWSTGNDSLTRVFASWPYMMAWTALLVATLGVAILLQLGRPSPAQGWAGFALAVAAGMFALVFLAEYATGKSFGLDQFLFSDAVRAVHWTWPGRPSTATAASVAFLATAVALTRFDHRWSRAAWPACLTAAAVLPTIAAFHYAFEGLIVLDAIRPSGQAVTTALSLSLLVVAALATRPDRNPIAWLLARPDRGTLIRLAGILAGYPIVVGGVRLLCRAARLHGDAVWVLSITVATVVVGVAVFFSSQYEQRLLIAKERLSGERALAESARAEAEERYHILADNSVDIISHLRDGEIVWTSPSAEASFGWPAEQWTGIDFINRMHPDDRASAVVSLQKVAAGEPTLTRFRLAASDGRYHWVESHAKTYLDATGNPDGVITASRIIDDRVEAERQLERLARFDSLTGLANRGETISRLEAALKSSRDPGPELGVLFCDIDQFKEVNDTCGHTVGDVVLTTVATRIRECLRHGDTVGRTGGDEMLILLPGIHNIDEADRIAKKVCDRVAEPIEYNGNTIHTTVSIGVTLAIPGESVTAATARVDAAMYRAKHAGRNNVTRI